MSERFDMKMEIIEIIQLTLFIAPKFAVCDFFYIFIFYSNLEDIYEMSKILREGEKSHPTQI